MRHSQSSAALHGAFSPLLILAIFLFAVGALHRYTFGFARAGRPIRHG